MSDAYYTYCPLVAGTVLLFSFTSSAESLRDREFIVDIRVCKLHAAMYTKQTSNGVHSDMLMIVFVIITTVVVFASQTKIGLVGKVVTPSIVVTLT